MEEREEVHTPTQSEFATFQVMANAEFINLKKGLPSPTLQLGSSLLEFAEEEEQYFPEVYVKEEEESIPYEFTQPQPQQPLNTERKEREEELTPSIRSFDDQQEEEVEVEEKQKPLPTPIDSPKNVPRRRRSEDSLQSARPFASSQPKEEASPRKYKETTRAEIDAEKEGLLAELHNLERQGVAKLLRPLSMNDSLEEIQFQFDRIQAELNATQMVDFAKSAIKMGSGMLEMVLKKAGIRVVDGYHTNLCKDMNKFNRPLSRMYKKYWRRGGMTPEAELGMLVFGSLAWTVVQNKMGSATAAFTGASDVPVSASEPAPKAPSSAPRMRPPQMNSLNVPSSWTSNMADLAQDNEGQDFSEPPRQPKSTKQKPADTAETSAAEAASAAAASAAAATRAAKFESEKSAALMREAEKKLALVEMMRKDIEARELRVFQREESLDSQSYKSQDLDSAQEQEYVAEQEKQAAALKSAKPTKVVSLSKKDNASLNASSKSARRRSTIINLDA